MNPRARIVLLGACLGFAAGFLVMPLAPVCQGRGAGLFWEAGKGRCGLPVVGGPSTGA